MCSVNKFEMCLLDGKADRASISNKAVTSPCLIEYKFRIHLFRLWGSSALEGL